jgi:Bacterial SH3 domain
MGFHRSALLSVMAMGFMTGAVLCRPVYAEEGELIAQEDKAQINVRSLANTQADIVAAGAVGDRVQILEHSVGNDALIWYRVKLLKSGETGWIRGDLIKILGSSAQKAAEKPAPQSKSSAPAHPKPSEAVKTSATPPANPVPLTPPKPPASVKSSAPPAVTAAKASVLPSSKPTASPPSNWGGAETATPKPAPAPAPSAAPVTALNSSTTTIVSFQTSTYAVRVFSESGQLRLNLFNRKTKAIALSAVPVQGKSSSDGTTYSYQGDVKVTILVPASGQPTLSAVALGETLKEQSEVAPAPAASAPAASAPAASAPVTSAPAASAPAPATPTAPEAPASPALAPVPQQ